MKHVQMKGGNCGVLGWLQGQLADPEQLGSRRQARHGMTLAEEEPGHRSIPGVACRVAIPALEIQVLVARATCRSQRGSSCRFRPARTTHRLRQVWRQM